MGRVCVLIFLILVNCCGLAFALSGSVGRDGSNALAVQELGYTGSGIHIGQVTLNNIFVEHPAFEDSNGVLHAINHDVTGRGFSYNYHDTPFAGIIISNGDASHPNDVGVAPGAFVHCARVVYESDIEDVLDELILNQDCKIIMTGFQLSYASNGQSQQVKMYDYYADNYDVIFVNAAGNNDSEISVFGDAYNGITTGALETAEPNVYTRVGNITNPGPTNDGRAKPEVMAPSTDQVAPSYTGGWWAIPNDGATSWAVPHTAGVAALLLDYVANTPGTEEVASHTEVIKSVIVNSTFPNIDDKSGDSTNPADSNNAWHSERGYGRIDALRALQTLQGGRVNTSSLITSDAGWGYGSIGRYQTHSYQFQGRKNDRFVFTVTWNRGITKSGSSYFEQTPKMNIDVSIRNSSGVVTFEDESLNNLEKFDIVLPADDIYTVELANQTSNKGRNYGFAFELLRPIVGDFNVDYIVDLQDISLFMNCWLEPALPEIDIGDDGAINFLDFSESALNWLVFDAKYYSP